MPANSLVNRKTFFELFLKRIARAAGHPRSFAIALATILFWSVLSPMHNFSETWQFVINTNTTIVSFLIAFLVQYTQSRDGEAIHLKLDELIRRMAGANNVLLKVEELNENEFSQIRCRYSDLACLARKEMLQGGRGYRQPIRLRK